MRSNSTIHHLDSKQSWKVRLRWWSCTIWIKPLMSPMRLSATDTFRMRWSWT